MQVLKETPILDHGYLRFIEKWGGGDAGESEAGIIEAARQSTQGNFRSWQPYTLCERCGAWKIQGVIVGQGDESCGDVPQSYDHLWKEYPRGDEGLLAFLFSGKPQHATPFEFAGMVIEVQAPIAVFREWHRHRTQCLYGDSLIHFDMPARSRNGKHTVYKQKIKDLWAKWQPTLRAERQERQTNPLWPRSRIQGMLLRTLDEGTGEFTTSTITGIVRGEPKEMVRVTTDSGRTLTATLSHKVFTTDGWSTVEQAANSGVGLAMEGTSRDKATSWEPEQPTQQEIQEARHKNHNRLDCRFENLEWGSSGDNSCDMLADDRNQRLVATYEEIRTVEYIGEHPTYDIAVCDPWHNFVADGFVVHNSYNEMSARYAPLPDLNYIPTVERLMMAGGKNKQAGAVKGSDELTAENAQLFRLQLETNYCEDEELYQRSLKNGVPKELARLCLPVGRYSRMRACTSLRNWLAFLTLRMDPAAQWEIRQFANAVGDLIAEHFPRTWKLFVERAAR